MLYVILILSNVEEQQGKMKLNFWLWLRKKESLVTRKKNIRNTRTPWEINELDLNLFIENLDDWLSPEGGKG